MTLFYKKFFTSLLLLVVFLPMSASADWRYMECGRGGCVQSTSYLTRSACDAARVGRATAQACTGNDGPPTGGSGPGNTGNAPSAISTQVINYRFLAPLPGVDTSGDLLQYLITALQFLIGVAGVIGVIRLVICGFSLLLAPGESQRSHAKECLWKVVLGLLLAISAFVLLRSINPDLITPKFDLPATATTQTPPQQQPTGCSTCVNLGVPAKLPGSGCALPGPCQIASAMNTKLVALQGMIGGWWVTESYPPTRVHRNSCHPNGTCVDADYTDNRSGAADVVNFITAAQRAGLTAVYEVSTQADYDRILPAIRAAGLPASSLSNQGGWITGNHFSVYNN